MWSSARAAREGERAARMSSSKASWTAGVVHQRSSATGSSPASVAAAAISAGSSSSPPAITRTRKRRSSASSTAGAFKRVATTARQAGSEDAGRGYGAGSIGIP